MSRTAPRAVTMEMVAREAGVSRQLVSLVIRDVGYVSPEKRSLVLDAAARLGYRRNTLAAGLAGRRTLSIGLAVLDLHNQVYADIADGVMEVLGPAGYKLLIVATARRGATGRADLEPLVGLRVDGLLLATHLTEDLDLEHALAGTPAVSIGSKIELAGIGAVFCDDRLGLRLATEHLISQGHQDIAYVGGPHVFQDSARRAGYREAMAAAALGTCEEDGNATEYGGIEAFSRLQSRDRRPTAITCYNDETAMGVLGAARRLGLRIPEDVAVIGYDNTRPADYPGVDLTSVDQQARAIGARAAGMLLEQIEDAERPAVIDVLTPRLVVRHSSSFDRSLA